MTAHEYLQLIGIKEDSCKELAFMVAEFKGDRHTGYHVYHSTPRRNVWDWYNTDRTRPEERVRAQILDYYVLNTKTYDQSWLSGGSWNNDIDKGYLLMLLVISPKELQALYGAEQSAELISFIDKRIREQIHKL